MSLIFFEKISMNRETRHAYVVIIPEFKRLRQVDQASLVYIINLGCSSYLYSIETA